MRARSIFLAGPVAVLLSVPVAAQERFDFQGVIQGCSTGHEVRLEASRRYVVTASSEAFDTVLGVYRPDQPEAVAEDDDGGGGTNSRLELVPPADGDYRICVSSFRGGVGGAYTVAVEPAAPLPAPVTRATASETASWRVYEGTLGGGDPLDGGRPFDDYGITLGAGERALISLESTAFDPMLEIYSSDRRGGEPIATDDDSGGALHAFTVLAPDAPGSFIVRVKGFDSSEGGAYRLRVSTGAIPPRPGPASTASATSAD